MLRFIFQAFCALVNQTKTAKIRRLKIQTGEMLIRKSISLTRLCSFVNFQT